MNISRRQILLGGGALATSSGLAGCNRGPRTRDLSDLSLPQLTGLTRRGVPVGGLANGELKQGVTVLVSWATWCGACRHNHNFLLESRDARRFVMAGVINYDSEAKAQQYLQERGNPYDFVAFDRNNKLLQLTGMTAVPTTYIVDQTAIIRNVFVGSFSKDRLATEFLPALRKLINF
jgi:thiol-disulfide isomerase/thioredoxin